MDTRIDTGRTLVAMTAALAASACSTTPRHFTPQFAAPAPDAAKLDRDLAICDNMIRAGRKGGFAAAATQTTVGAAAGFGAGAAATGLATSSASGLSAIGTGVGAGVAGMLLVAPLAAWGVSRAIRSGREKKYVLGMNNCLVELGYKPSAWVRGRHSISTVPASPTPAAQEPATPSTPTPVATEPSSPGASPPS